jgi:CO/xanthine dehydrogenase FAD-binding subunit
VRRFEIALPRTIDDCLKVLSESAGDTKVVAGGTDLVPQMKNGVARPARVVDLSGIAPLRMLESANGGGLRVGGRF